MEDANHGTEQPAGSGGPTEPTALISELVRSEEKSTGRPFVPIELLQLEKLCHINATQREIAAFFSCSVDTIARRAAADPRFADAMERGYMGGWMSLRRKQMEIALEGNPTMLIWLGKQLLGQRDNLDTKLTGSGPNGELQIDVSAAEIIRRELVRVEARGTEE